MLIIYREYVCFLSRRVCIVAWLLVFVTFLLCCINEWSFWCVTSHLRVFLHQQLVGRLIGKQGNVVNFIQQNSGAQIYISTKRYTEDSQICHIEGEWGWPRLHFNSCCLMWRGWDGRKPDCQWEKNRRSCYRNLFWTAPKLTEWSLSLQVRSSRWTKPCHWLGRR